MDIKNIFILTYVVILVETGNVNAIEKQHNPSVTEHPQLNPLQNLILNQSQHRGNDYSKGHEHTLSRVKRQYGYGWDRYRYYPIPIIFGGGFGGFGFGPRGFGGRGFGYGGRGFGGRGFGGRGFGGRGFGGIGGRGIGGHAGGVGGGHGGRG